MPGIITSIVEKVTGNRFLNGVHPTSNQRLMTETPKVDSPVSGDVQVRADTTGVIRQFFQDPARIKQSIVEIVYELELPEHRSITVTADVETTHLTAVYRDWETDDEFDLEKKAEIDIVRWFLDEYDSPPAA